MERRSSPFQAALLLILGSVLMALAAGGLAWVQGGEPGVLLGGLVGGAAGGGGVLGLICFNRGRKLLARSADKVLMKDPRPPVLYLRPFVEDEAWADAPVGWRYLQVTTLEEQLASVMSEIGPYVAIGDPREDLPDLGAARLYVTDEVWQATVIELMSRARLVVLRAGKTEAFRWEMREAVRRVAPENLLLIVPQNDELYAAFRVAAEEILPCRLPPTAERKSAVRGIGCLLHFGPHWTPQFLPARLPWLRGSFINPVAPALKLMLRPIFEQLHEPWTPPPLSYPLVLILLLFLVIVGILPILQILSWARSPVRTEVSLGGPSDPVRTPAASTYDEANARYEQRMLESAEFVSRFRGVKPADAERLGSEMARSGLRRLSDERLVQRAELLARLQMASDTAACAAFERGVSTEEQLRESMGRLDAPDIEAWFRVVEEAALAELRESPAPVPVDERVRKNAFSAIVQGLPPNKASLLLAILEDLKQAADEDVCWAGRTIYTGLLALEEPSKSALARAIVP